MPAIKKQGFLQEYPEMKFFRVKHWKKSPQDEKMMKIIDVIWN